MISNGVVVTVVVVVVVVIQPNNRITKQKDRHNQTKHPPIEVLSKQEQAFQKVCGTDEPNVYMYVDIDESTNNNVPTAVAAHQKLRVTLIPVHTKR